MRDPVEELKLPTWLKVWLAVVALAGAGFIGLLAWAIITIVVKVAR